MVGIEPRIRVSSVTAKVCLSRGTLRSHRTSTRLPFSSSSLRSEMLFLREELWAGGVVMMGGHLPDPGTIPVEVATLTRGSWGFPVAEA